jgi:hypothetical protein
MLGLRDSILTFIKYSGVSREGAKGYRLLQTLD